MSRRRSPRLNETEHLVPNIDDEEDGEVVEEPQARPQGKSTRSAATRGARRPPVEKEHSPELTAKEVKAKKEQEKKARDRAAHRDKLKADRERKEETERKMKEKAAEKKAATKPKTQPAPKTTAANAEPPKKAAAGKTKAGAAQTGDPGQEKAKKKAAKTAKSQPKKEFVKLKGVERTRLKNIANLATSVSEFIEAEAKDRGNDAFYEDVQPQARELQNALLALYSKGKEMTVSKGEEDDEEAEEKEVAPKPTKNLKRGRKVIIDSDDAEEEQDDEDEPARKRITRNSAR